ncbi:MAG: hypothetical protein IJ944_02985 [Clostridia bacterium]|nr:hypothetical protein [Clostridia bacterium]
MKKVLALCLAIMVVLGLSVTVFAAPNFVKSPSGKPAPGVEDFIPDDDDCTADLVVTPFDDINDLEPAQKEDFQIAYDTIIKTDDVTKLNEEIAKKAEDLGIDPDDVDISDLFYVDCDGCDDHDNHTNGKIILDIDNPETFMGVIYLDENGKWQWVDGAVINGNGKLEFTAIDLDAPYAIVVNNTNGAAAGDKDPGTGEGMGIFFWIAFASTTALLLVLVLILFKKKRA